MPTVDLRPGFVMKRFVRLQDVDRSFDIEYWQRQGDAAIFARRGGSSSCPAAIEGWDGMNSDFKDLLKLFNEYKVRYLVVGG